MTLTNKAQKAKKAAKAERAIKTAARKVVSEETKARMLAAIAQKAAKQSSSMSTMLVVFVRTRASWDFHILTILDLF